MQHRGVVYGLWAPLLEQAKVAGASLAGRPAAFHGVVPATTLKVAGVELFCCGGAIAGDGDEEVLALDSRRGRYRRLVLRDGRLRGAIVLGDLADARELRRLLASSDLVPDERLDRAPADTGALAQDPDATICSCMDVSHGAIAEVVRDRGLRTIAQVSEHTRAGTGCGGCRPDVARILRAQQDATREPLAAGGPRPPGR